MENCMVPEQVVFNILVWLPVVSLLRFRSVCKTWCALIDSSHFISQHLLHPNDDTNNGSLILCAREPVQWFVLSGHQFEERVNLDLSAHLPLHEYDDINYVKYGYNYIEDTTWMPLGLVASCNGIICLSCERPIGRERVALWNPATKNLACLPEPPNWSEEYVCTDLGFGHAVKANDYKVVRVVQFLNPDASAAYNRVEAYSLQTDSWRNIDADLPAGPSTLGVTTYWNGHFFWLLRLPEGYDPPAIYSILSFDLSNEVFKTIQLPDAISTKTCQPYLSTTRDCIACIDSVLPLGSHHGHFDIWVLNDYGVKESWTKLYMIRLIGTFPFLCLEGFSENGKFLLLHNQIRPGFELGLCDLKTQEMKNLQVQFTKVAVYKQSLVSVKRKGLLTSEQE